MIFASKAGSKTTAIHISFLFIVFAFCAWWSFSLHGVKGVNDSHRYLNYAAQLNNGFYAEHHNIWYVGYVLFIWTVHHVVGSDSQLTLVVAQYCLSLIALLCVYQTSKKLFNRSDTAFVTGLLYLFFVEIMFWNSYILCESIYMSFICISLYFLTRVYTEKRSVIFIIFTVLIVGFTFFIKPTGIALFAGLLSVFVSKYWIAIGRPFLQLAFGMVGLIIVVLIANQMLASYHFIENYRIGEVVYAISTLPTQEHFQHLMVNVPEDLSLPSTSYPPVVQILLFILFNIKYWTVLFFTKVFFLLSHVRPFWSMQHNVFNLIFLLPVYFFSVRALLRSKVDRPITVFSMVYLLVHVLSVGLTSVDWDGRFLLPMLPLMFVLAASEATWSIRKANKRIFHA